MKQTICLMLAALAVSVLGSQSVEAASPVECRQFADFAIRINGNYQKARCPATPMMHGDRQRHYQWCLARPTTAVLDDQHAKQIAFDRCTAGRGARPQGAGLPPPQTGACTGLSGSYNGNSGTITVMNGNRIRVTVGPRRPVAFGTCSGNRLSVNFTDDRVITGVLNGRTIAWDNRTNWTRD